MPQANDLELSASAMAHSSHDEINGGALNARCVHIINCRSRPPLPGRITWTGKTKSLPSCCSVPSLSIMIGTITAPISLSFSSLALKPVSELRPSSFDMDSFNKPTCLLLSAASSKNPANLSSMYFDKGSTMPSFKFKVFSFGVFRLPLRVGLALPFSLPKASPPLPGVGGSNSAPEFRPEPEKEFS